MPANTNANADTTRTRTNRVDSDGNKTNAGRDFAASVLDALLAAQEARNADGTPLTGEQWNRFVDYLTLPIGSVADGDTGKQSTTMDSATNMVRSIMTRRLPKQAEPATTPAE